MQAINLLPKGDGRSRPGVPSPWILLAALAPILAIVLVYMDYSSKHSAVSAKSAQLAQVEARVAALTPSASAASAQADFVTERVQRESALQDALVKRESWDVFLSDLARVLPADVYLTSLSATSPTPADTAATPAPAPVATTTTTTTTTATSAPVPVAPTVNATAFTVSGNAPNHAAVALLLARLSLLPGLSNVALQQTVGGGATGSSSSATPAAAGGAVTATSTSAGKKKGTAKLKSPPLSFQISAAVNPPEPAS
jgi:Tfp pilus assembly protein PilN